MFRKHTNATMIRECVYVCYLFESFVKNEQGKKLTHKEHKISSIQIHRSVSKQCTHQSVVMVNTPFFLWWLVCLCTLVEEKEENCRGKQLKKIISSIDDSSSMQLNSTQLIEMKQKICVLFRYYCLIFHSRIQMNSHDSFVWCVDLTGADEYHAWNLCVWFFSSISFYIFKKTHGFLFYSTHFC